MTALLQLEQRLAIRVVRLAELKSTNETVEEVCADYEACCSKLLRLEQSGDAATHQARDDQEVRINSSGICGGASKTPIRGAGGPNGLSRPKMG